LFLWASLELLLRRTSKVGIFRPVIEVPPDKGRDKNIDLLLTYFNLPIDYEAYLRLLPA
jgi:phosphate acetyltransferase